MTSMTPLQQLRPVLREAIGVHAILERMGFPMEDIYMVCAPVVGTADGYHVVVLLVSKAQGREFRYDCGPIDMPAVTVDDEWPQIARAAYAAWNAAGQTERSLLFEHCEARKRAVSMVAAVVTAGIRPPGGEL